MMPASSPVLKVVSLASRIEQIREFNRFYTSILGLLNDRLLESPVSLTEARVLFEIKERPHCKAGDIMTLLRMDRGYLSRLINKLEKQGWVSRESSQTDRRVRTLSLTRAGRKLMEELERRSRRQVESMLAPLTVEEENELLQAMERIKALLSHGAPPQPR
jgi:DNA-binding MarR family transcriptional regulator